MTHPAGDRRRPGHGAGRVPLAARRRARLRGGRRGRQRRGGASRSSRGWLPDVTLMDIRMPVLDGIAATRRAGRRRRCRRKVLVLTTFDLDEYVFEALRAGASGFLLKDAPAEELAAAIRVVAAGESLLAPGVTRRVIDAFVRRPAPPPRHREPRLDAADAARARGARPARARAVQPRHRQPAVRLRGHHQDPREQRAHQAGPARPGAGGDLRLRERAWSIPGDRVEDPSYD